MDRPSLQEQFDACRKIADATDDPRLRELAQALENDSDLARRLEAQAAFDQRFTALLHDVPVPVGLSERLASAFRDGAERFEQNRSRGERLVGDRLSGDKLGEGLMAKVLGASPTSEGEATLVNRPATDEARRTLTPKRRIWGKAAAGVAALLVLAMVFLAWPPGATQQPLALSERDFAELALQLARAPEGEWRESAAQKAPLEWARPAGMLASGVSPQRWKPLSVEHPGRWIVWELNSPAGGRVYLLATDAEWEANLLAPTLSRNPIYNSGGWSVGVWRREGAAYALVCEGSRASFRNLVRVEDLAALGR